MHSRRTRQTRLRSESVSRSPSRALYEDGPVTAQQVPWLIKEQQEFLVELLSEHKQEVEVKLRAKQRRFTSKRLEKQFEVNTKVAELTDKSLAAVRRNSRRKAKAALKQLRDEIREHQEDLVIADTSPNCWLAVAKLRNRSELSDELRRKLEKVDKEIWRCRSYGGAQKKFSKFQNHGQGGKVRTNRGLPQRRLPEELLFNAAKQIRRGNVPTATKKTTSTGNARISGRRYRSHGRRGR